MSTQTVTPGQSVSQPVTCAETVAELRRIADALESLGTLPPGEERAPWLSLSLLPETTAGVDAVALAVLGKPAVTFEISGTWYHVIHGSVKFGRGALAVQTTVPSPHESELERLRAEVASLRALSDAERSGLGYSREADDPAPVSPARVPPHNGAVVDGGGLVDETPGGSE